MKKLLVTLIALVKTGFTNFNAKKLAQKGLDIFNALTGNLTFPDPDPDLVALKALIDALQKEISASQDGDRVAIKAREQARLNLINALKSIGAYVNYASGGSQELAATSGFDLYKNRESVTITAIKRLKVENLPNTNALTISAVGGRGCKSFVFQLNADGKMDDANTLVVNATTRKITIPNLVANVLYTITVTGIGSKGQTVKSDPITRIVQ